jgi:hypothetical protein
MGGGDSGGGVDALRFGLREDMVNVISGNADHAMARLGVRSESLQG